MACSPSTCKNWDGQGIDLTYLAVDWRTVLRHRDRDCHRTLAGAFARIANENAPQGNVHRWRRDSSADGQSDPTGPYMGFYGSWALPPSTADGTTSTAHACSRPL